MLIFHYIKPATHTLNTGPEDIRAGTGNSCWEQAVHLAPRRPAPLSCAVGDRVFIDASRSDTSPHFAIRTDGSDERAETAVGLRVGEAAVMKLNDLELHSGFETALGHAMMAWQQQSGCDGGGAVLDMRGDWACTAAAALRHGAGYCELQYKCQLFPIFFLSKTQK